MPTIEYKVTADTAQFDSSIKASQGSLKAATKAAAALVAGVVALGAAYISLVEDIVATTDEINTLSRATGLSRESINGLRLAAIASGKSLKDIVPKNLAKNLLAARDGSKAMKDAFGSLGVEVADSSGNLRDADVVFRELITALNGMGNETERAAIAAVILGKQGRELLSAFDGVEGFEQFVALGGQFGTRVGPEAVAATAAWQKATANLGLAFEELKVSVVETFGGPGGLASTLEDFSLGFLFMIEFVESLVNGLMTNIKLQASALGALLRGDLEGFAAAMVEQQGPADLMNRAFKDATDRAKEFFILAQTEAPETGDAIEDGIVVPIEKAGKAAQAALPPVQDLFDVTTNLAEISARVGRDTETAQEAAERSYAATLEAIFAQLEAVEDLGAAGIDVSDAAQAAADAELAARQRLARDLTEINMAANAERLEIEVAAREQRLALGREENEIILEEHAARIAAQQEAEAGRILLIQEGLNSVLETTQIVTQIILQNLGEEGDATRDKLDTQLAINDASRAEGEAVTLAQKAKTTALRDQLKETQKGIKRAFAARQAAAVAGILIDGAQSILALTPFFAFLGPGAPAAAAGVVIPVGLAQTALVLSQSAPTVHDGTANTDEVLATLRRQEAVLNQRAAEDIGRDRISAANRGEGFGGGPRVNQIVFQRRVLDTMMSQTIRAGGATQDLIAAGRPPAGALDPFGGQ